MIASKELCVLALVIADCASISIPTRTMASTITPATFVWQDETVYRPDCPSNDHDRRSFPSSICTDKRCWP